MADAVVLPASAAAPRVALVGNPNCGKTALFNRLTGARQKVANYPGVTVERKTGIARLADGAAVEVIDLPGTYSLTPATADEQVALEVIEGRLENEARPDLLVAVVDATNLRMGLRLVLELRRLRRPMLVALNMADVAAAKGLAIDTTQLSLALGCPVVSTVAVRSQGHAPLLLALGATIRSAGAHAPPPAAPAPLSAAELQREVRRLLTQAAPQAIGIDRFQHRIDAVVMHPVWGPALLAAMLFLIFQAVFSWAALPMEAIKYGVAALGEAIGAALADGPLRSLLIDGVIAGAGSVLVFLPQIVILFFFILLLEDSGYLPRAAFLLDSLMGKVGLSGRAFLPLLSSFACAVPGILATRTLAHRRDRVATILIAPLMTCSARLPVYALLIGAFVPERAVGPFNLRGLTLFALYAAGVGAACAVAWVLKRGWLRAGHQPLMLELPPYRLPTLGSLMIGLWERVRIFMRRVGGIIFSLMVLLWFASSWPAPPPGAGGPTIQYSLAGMAGHALQPLVEPIGFNWQIAIALVPGLAAREVAVGALGTVYALSAAGDAVAQSLTPVIAAQWSPATAYALLAWYVFAPQCLSTLVVARRETQSWRVPALMGAYLFALAYAAAFVVFRVSSWVGA